MGAHFNSFWYFLDFLIIYSLIQWLFVEAIFESKEWMISVKEESFLDSWQFEVGIMIVGLSASIPAYLYSPMVFVTRNVFLVEIGRSIIGLASGLLIISVVIILARWMNYLWNSFTETSGW